MPKQITGGAGKWPIFDRNWDPIHVGDKVRAQICVGIYGQTSLIEAVITDAYYPYCQMCTPRGTIRFDFSFGKNALIGYNKHVDFDHGHETWVEVIK